MPESRTPANGSRMTSDPDPAHPAGTCRCCRPPPTRRRRYCRSRPLRCVVRAQPDLASRTPARVPSATTAWPGSPRWPPCSATGSPFRERLLVVRHLWLPGRGVERAVLVTAAAVHRGSARRGPRSLRCTGTVVPGSRTCTASPSTGLLRSRTQADQWLVLTRRDLMYAAAERLDPDTYRSRHGGVRRDGAGQSLWRVGEFHYRTTTAAAPAAEENAMGVALADAAAAAGLRPTLPTHPLPQLRRGRLTARSGLSPVRGIRTGAAPGAGGRAAPLASWWTALVGAGPGRPGRRDPGGHRGWAYRARRAAARARRRAGRAGGARRRCTAAPRSRSCATPVRSARAPPPCTPLHLTGDDVAALRPGTGVCFCPTTERDLGDGIGPAPALLTAPCGPRAWGPDSHARTESFGGGPVPWSCTSGCSGRNAACSTRPIAKACHGSTGILAWLPRGCRCGRGRLALISVADGPEDWSALPAAGRPRGDRGSQATAGGRDRRRRGRVVARDGHT
ncbi:hypothetical protein HBB16_02005 [Pseudonocardia sp. MCCB 268]|nr:hypothetical protein [Pseudonocardia cytotoxica]